MAKLSLIKKIASAKGITIKQLADEIGITEAGLHKLIRDNTTTVRTLEAISAKLNVSPCVFFDSDGGVSSLANSGDGAKIGVVHESPSAFVDSSASVSLLINEMSAQRLLAESQLNVKDNCIDRLLKLVENYQCSNK
jgi:DNA-binding Xre family transcriptional regulator